MTDLLPKDKNATLFHSLKIKENNQGEGYSIDGLVKYKVNDAFQCLNLLRLGERNRINKQKQLGQNGIRATTIF